MISFVARVSTVLVLCGCLTIAVIVAACTAGIDEDAIGRPLQAHLRSARCPYRRMRWNLPK